MQPSNHGSNTLTESQQRRQLFKLANNRGNAMTSKQKIRRAGKRWRENAPDIFVDAFDDGDKYLDRYTVFVLPVDEYKDEIWVTYLGTSAKPQCYGGWGQMRGYQAREFRFKNGRKRISWGDLPEDIRETVTYWSNQ